MEKKYNNNCDSNNNGIAKWLTILSKYSKAHKSDSSVYIFAITSALSS